MNKILISSVVMAQGLLSTPTNPVF